MDTKTLKFNLKSLSEDGSFIGEASTFGNEDLGGDVVLPGAFKRTIKNSGGDVPILYQHMVEFPIGSGKAAESSRALPVEGQLLINANVPKADEAYSLMKAGIMRGLSIGYDIVSDYYEKGVHYLKELKLWEFSPVVFAMNELAQTTAIKGLADRRRRKQARIPDLGKQGDNGSFNELREDLEEAIEQQVFGGAEAVEVYIADFGPDWAVFTVCQGYEWSDTLYQVAYSQPSDDVFTIGTPFEVEAETSYAPVSEKTLALLRDRPGTLPRARKGLAASVSSSDLHLLKTSVDHFLSTTKSFQEGTHV